ncbi:MAG: DUF2130 domain-containing protein, partial [Lachnospiraceae bacterium]|nr:DUF2130 domain-containing protein [Candidatus Minthocola equi]
MNEIKCPKCGEIFQVDESGYASILQQVRDTEFNKELERRQRELIDKAELEKKLAITEAVREKEKELAEKGNEITRLQG